MEAIAKLKNCPMSARKMRMVANVVRGKDVDHALNILKFTKKEGAIWMEKIVMSAIANWEQKNDMAEADEHDLFVKAILVDEGTQIKRFRPAPHGRAHRIRKRTNHVTVTVSNRVAVEGNNDSAEEVEVEIED